MYWTPEGSRILAGSEAELFVEALAVMVDLLIDDEWEFGQSVFDRLQFGQKLVVLNEMASSLLIQEEPMPRLTAVIESAVASVYQWIEEMVRMELDVEEGESESHPVRMNWRQLVTRTCEECGISELPDADSTDMDEWQMLIEVLSERILWDRDFEDEDCHLDTDPEASAEVKRLLGIDDDYFVAVPPEPNEIEVRKLAERLRVLTNSAR